MWPCLPARSMPLVFQTAFSQPERMARRLRLSAAANGACRGRCRPGLRCCQRDHRSARAFRTPHPQDMPRDSFDRCRRMAGIRCGARPANGVRGRDSSHVDRSGDPVLAANGPPMVLAGRRLCRIHPVVSASMARPSLPWWPVTHRCGRIATACSRPPISQQDEGDIGPDRDPRCTSAIAMGVQAH